MNPQQSSFAHPGGADLLVRDARAWPAEGAAPRIDVRVRAGRIAEIGEQLAPQGEPVLDARGLALVPGLLDCHVHFRDPGLERKEGWLHGSAGALHGGVTSVAEVQNNPPLSTSRAALEARHAHVRTRASVDYALFANLLPDSLPELDAMAELTPAFKCFLGGSTGLGGVLEREVLRELFASAARAGRRIVAHCEDEHLLRADKLRFPEASAAEHHLVRSEQAEVESIRTAIDLCAETGAELHVFHISTARGVELVRAARARGQRVWASSAPHYLLLSCLAAPALGNLLKVNPSIKTPADAEGILAGLADGTVDALGTDHAPHPLDEKQRAYAHAPSGMPSVDLLWPLVLAIVERMGLAPARALDSVGLAAARSLGVLGKGALAPGCDGDLVLFDPRARREVRAAELPSRSKWSAYEGWSLAGWPQFVVRRGSVLLERGRVRAAAASPGGGAQSAGGGAPLALEPARPRARGADSAAGRAAAARLAEGRRHAHGDSHGGAHGSCCDG